MYQGTTPTLTFNVEGADLTDKAVFVTIRCGNYSLTKTGENVAVSYVDGDSTVVIRLTQQETLLMRESIATVQIRFVDESGQADATNKAKFDVESVLYNKVIEYEGGDGE